MILSMHQEQRTDQQLAKVTLCPESFFKLEMPKPGRWKGFENLVKANTLYSVLGKIHMTVGSF